MQPVVISFVAVQAKSKSSATSCGPVASEKRPKDWTGPDFKMLKTDTEVVDQEVVKQEVLEPQPLDNEM